VSEADMEKGHLRCDANISLRPIGDTKLYPKTEVKNLNSFRSVERALQYEVKRQTELWEQNAAPNFTSTRGWDENKQITIEQRRKEGSSDYRYFPEPDLPPLVISDQMLAYAQSSLPELPQAKLARLMSEFALNFNEAEVLVKNKDWADYFESVVSELAVWFEQKSQEPWENHKAKLAKLTCGWLTSEVYKLLLNDFKFRDLKITPENMAEFLSLIHDHTINSTAGQKMLAEMFKTGDDPSHLLEKLDLGQIDDLATLEDLVIKVFMLYPEQLAELKNGKEALLRFFVGKVMAESKGKANPQKIEEIIKNKI
jgi:aspartyl-tRNA(Asn)/glutamyl-tRNA(Gln) amidotransferase subunit B